MADGTEKPLTEKQLKEQELEYAIISIPLDKWEFVNIGFEIKGYCATINNATVVLRALGAYPYVALSVKTGETTIELTRGYGALRVFFEKLVDHINKCKNDSDISNINVVLTELKR